MSLVVAVNIRHTHSEKMVQFKMGEENIKQSERIGSGLTKSNRPDAGKCYVLSLSVRMLQAHNMKMTRYLLCLCVCVMCTYVAYSCQQIDDVNNRADIFQSFFFLHKIAILYIDLQIYHAFRTHTETDRQRHTHTRCADRIVMVNMQI